MTTRIQNGKIERLYSTALDSSGSTITGLSDMLIEILRKSDNFYLDFNDNTFKNSDWTTRQQIMTELDATNSPGIYYYNFDTTGFSDDEYFIRVTSVTAINDPMEGELKVGDYVDNINASISSRASESNATTNKNSIITEIDVNEVKIDNIDTSAESQARFDEIKGAGWTNETLKAIYDSVITAGIKDWTNTELAQIRDALGIDGSKTTAIGGQLQNILGLSQQNFVMSGQVYDINNNLTSATVKIYNNKSDADSQVNEIKTYIMTATYNTNNLIISYKMTEV